MLRKLTPPAPLPTAADRRLGRSARIWTGGAAAFSQAVRDRWDLGLDGLYPDAPLVFLEAEEDRQLPPAGEVHLTQLTLRLLIQLSETIAAGRTPAAAMEQNSLDDSIRHCLTALETQNRESCRELQTLRTRLIAVSALPGRQKKTELAAVRETAERRLAQSVSRNAAAAGDFARTAEEAGPAAPGSRAAEASPAAGTKRRGRAQKPDLAGKPAGEKPGETAPQAPFARSAGTLPGREPSPEPAAARRLGGARRIAQTISFLQALPAYGGLTAYRRFSEPEQSRLAEQNLRRETLIALLSAAPSADREAVWQAAELSLAHFPQTAGDNPAAHTPERLAAGLRTGTDKEWTRLLRTAERRLTTAEAAPAAPAPSEENRAALAAAAPLLRTLHRALAVKPLDRKSLAAEVRSALPPAQAAFWRLAAESGAASPALAEGGAAEIQRALLRLVRKAPRQELEALEKQLRAPAPAAQAAPAAKAAAALRSFLREDRQAQRLRQAVDALPPARRQALLREWIPRQRELPAPLRLWEHPGLSETQRLVYLLRREPEAVQAAAFGQTGASLRTAAAKQIQIRAGGTAPLFARPAGAGISSAWGGSAPAARIPRQSGWAAGQTARTAAADGAVSAPEPARAPYPAAFAAPGRRIGFPVRSAAIPGGEQIAPLQLAFLPALPAAAPAYAAAPFRAPIPGAAPIGFSMAAAAMQNFSAPGAATQSSFAPDALALLSVPGTAPWSREASESVPGSLRIGSSRAKNRPLSRALWGFGTPAAAPTYAAAPFRAPTPAAAPIGFPTTAAAMQNTSVTTATMQSASATAAAMQNFSAPVAAMQSSFAPDALALLSVPGMAPRGDGASESIPGSLGIGSSPAQNRPLSRVLRGFGTPAVARRDGFVPAAAPTYAAAPFRTPTPGAAPIGFPATAAAMQSTSVTAAMMQSVPGPAAAVQPSFAPDALALLSAPSAAPWGRGASESVPGSLRIGSSLAQNRPLSRALRGFGTPAAARRDGFVPAAAPTYAAAPFRASTPGAAPIGFPATAAAMQSTSVAAAMMRSVPGPVAAAQTSFAPDALALLSAPWRIAPGAEPDGPGGVSRRGGFQPFGGAGAFAPGFGSPPGGGCRPQPGPDPAPLPGGGPAGAAADGSGKVSSGDAPHRAGGGAPHPADRAAAQRGSAPAAGHHRAERDAGQPESPAGAAGDGG
jgi:hypothetical protein